MPRGVPMHRPDRKSRWIPPPTEIAQSTDQLHDEHVREMCEAWDSRHPRHPLTAGERSTLSAAEWRPRFRRWMLETRTRVEEFIGCTLEQSYSEFTVELKNAVPPDARRHVRATTSPGPPATAGTGGGGSSP